MESPIRRSSRARKPATTIYDEAAEREQERRKSLQEKRKKSASDESDDSSDDEDQSSVDSAEDFSDSDEDASVAKKAPPKQKKTLKKKVTPSKGSPALVKRKSLPAVVVKGSSRPRNATVAAKTAFTKARITQALRMLSKSVLNHHGMVDEDNADETNDVEEETPQTSLVAALLASAKPIPGIPSTSRPKSYYYYPAQAKQEQEWSETKKRTQAIVALCLPQLDGIVRHLVQSTEHGGPHELHVRLLNLLFRSVGGSTRTNISLQKDLDELEEDDWDEHISKVVTVMKNESDADQTLLIADDDCEGEDLATTLTTRQVGIFAYRTLYKEFWYRLGHVLLAHSPSTAVAMVSEDDNDDSDSDQDSDSDDSSEAPPKSKKRKTSKKKKDKNNQETFSSNRFQLEKVRDLILRMTELVSVGQPDLRACGTIAVLQLAKACVERSVELEQKIKVASRQLKAATKAGSKRKQQALQHQLDNWRRHKAELEEIVEGPVFSGVFIHRYRDANDRIRRDCLMALSEISLIRPDIFLVDTYLKYFGWMASDKAACVRVAALEGLLLPFGEAEHSATSGSPFSIDVQSMHNVTLKFLSRIVDCADDAHSLKVQELSTKLLLCMLKEEFLDEWEDDIGWDKVNLKALDALSSKKVRKHALYFVMDQLDAFDVAEQAFSLSEKKQSEQLVAIARWCANKLCDGFISIDKMNIELVDCLVESILGMPEHKELVLNWPMMLKAIRSENPQQGSANEREEIAAQRILLRMLATSAELELGKVSETATKKPKAAVISKRRRSSIESAETRLEQLSVALLKNLPHLLDAFKSDTMSLRDVTKLPSTITSAVLSLPSRKTDFQNLVRTLCQLYLDSTDEQTLKNIAQTLSQWVEGDHTRLSEVKINLKRMSGVLQDRLMKLFRESDPLEVASQKSKSSKRSKRSRRSSSSQTDGGSTVGNSTMLSATPEADAEHSISLLMLRWNILLMQCQPTFLFEKADGEEDEDEIEGLFLTISEAMGKRLLDRMPVRDGEEDDGASTKTIWKDLDPEVHEEVAITIQRALKVLLLIVSWELNDTLTERKEFENSEKKDSEDDMEIDEYNFPVLKLRDNLVKLLGLCFDQHLPDDEEVEYTNEQHEFAHSVQASAGQVASDLRTLFPFDWSKASDPVRRALALTNGEDFTFVLSGFARWFQSREDAAEEEDSKTSLVKESLLPLARVSTMNFDGFFRKEAAMIMQHISGSGSLASQMILSLSRTLKKTNPVRMLESQMACLRLAFENWLDTEPIVPEDTSPTDEEIQEFEEAEQKHLDAFANMEQVASKLSSTLGVAGRLANDSLKKSIFGFVREGIRYSFDGVENNQQDEDDLVVGSRLAFLLLLSKYSIWIKKEKSHLEQLTDFVMKKESELRRHPEFEEVHEDDLNALSDFKKSFGIKQKVSESSFGNDGSFSAATPSPIETSSRRSTLSALSKGSRTSRRSGMSAQSELSPLYEEEDGGENNGGDDDGNNESDGSPTPQKRRRLDSSSKHRGSSISKSTYRQGSIPEENESDSGKDSEE